MKGTMTILGLCLAMISGSAMASDFTEWKVGKNCEKIFSAGLGSNKDTQVFFRPGHGITVHVFDDIFKPTEGWESVKSVDGRYVTFVVEVFKGQMVLKPKSDEGRVYLLSKFYHKDTFSMGNGKFTSEFTGKGFRKALAEYEKCKPL